MPRAWTLLNFYNRIALFLIVILLAVSPLSTFAGARLRPSPEQIVAVFSDYKNSFQNQEGYRRFADMFFAGQMKHAPQYVKAALGKERFQKLNWGKIYNGSTEKFARDQGCLLDPECRRKYSNWQGYVSFAEDFYNGDMARAYVNASAVLDGDLSVKLGWGNSYRGLTKKFKLERKRLFANDLPVEKYVGQSGYWNFALDFYKDDMFLAYRNVAAALTDREREILGWKKAYRGSALEFEVERSRIFAGPEVKAIYLGPEGYAKFAEDFYDGDMFIAYTNASAALTPFEKEKLGWGKAYQGLSKDFKIERSRLMSEMYIGQNGYMKYAEDFYGGFMMKAYTNASAVLSDSEKESLNWGKSFRGTSKEFRLERDRLFNDYGPALRYLGKSGYVLFAEDFYKGDMLRAFTNASAVLSEDERAMLHWGTTFNGTTKEFARMREFLSTAGGDLDFTRWSGKNGLREAAESYLSASGNAKRISAKVRQKLRSILSEDERISFAWDRAPEDCEAFLVTEDVD